MTGAPRQVLHIIERLTLGGASRTLITAAAHSSRLTGTSHRILSLRAPGPAAAERAIRAGLPLAGPDQLAVEAHHADIVHIHFWNSPELYAALRGPMPPARILLTSHVGGLTAPHMLTDELIELADIILLTSSHSLEGANPALSAKARVAPSAADFERLRELRPIPHDGFVAGYVGAVDFAKIHPRFVAMHAAIDIPGLRVIICGEGSATSALKRQIHEAGAADRFELRGYVEDIASVLGEFDVFGYPLRKDTYATTELVLQESLYAGVPPVVFDHGGAAQSVRHGETGFVVTSEADYVDRVTELHRDPQMRQRMGAAAAADARARFGAANLVPLIDAAYDRLIEMPKRRRAPTPPSSGSEAFIRSLGTAATPFRQSLAGSDEQAISADRIIAEASPALASADAGGVLHYRRFFPDDPALRFWAGLILLNEGRPALASAEFVAAARLGFDHDRSLVNLERARAVADQSAGAPQGAGDQ